LCIPHGVTGTRSSGYIKKERPKKSIKRVSQEEFEKGDPDFIDERTKSNDSKKNKSFFGSFFE